MERAKLREYLKGKRAVEVRYLPENSTQDAVYIASDPLEVKEVRGKTSLVSNEGTCSLPLDCIVAVRKWQPAGEWEEVL